MLLLTLFATACAEGVDSTSPRSGDGAVFAKGGPGVSVTASDPSFGYQGDVAKRVVVTGSGFTTGAVAAWERNGVPDPKVTVLSTLVLSSTQIEATISIAPDADLAFYDISVTSSKGKGVGTEMFEVTTAIPIGTLGGSTMAYDASEGIGAIIVGIGLDPAGSQRAFAWSTATRTITNLGAGAAYAVDVAGLTIGGFTGSSELTGKASIWTRAGEGWSMTLLPVLASSPRSHVRSIASDGAGNAILAGGMEAVTVTTGKGKNATTSHVRPMLWRRDAGAWIRSPLTVPRAGSDVASAVQAVNARGQAVGGVRGGGLPDQSVFWDSLGTPTVLPGQGTPPKGIDGTGTVIAGIRVVSGVSQTQAVYWTAHIGVDGARTWSGPFDLPGSCQSATGVDDSGRIIGQSCLPGGSSRAAAVWSPPYESVTYLHGLGGVDGASVTGISRYGSLIVGGSNGFGVLWEYVLTPVF